MSSFKNKKNKTKLDDFWMESVLGKGTYAKVYLVKHKSTEKLYALKVLKKRKFLTQKNIKLILRERNLLITLKKHPFLVQFYAAFQSEDKLFFLIEYCPGGELFNLLHKRKRLSFIEAKFYSAQILLALEYLHNKNFIYRDLKPENILIDATGYIKLTDFGLSREISEEKIYSLCGTVEYLSPESFTKSGYGKEVDWWAFGILLYEMVVGQPPFYHENRSILFEQIKNSQPIMPNGLPQSLENLILGLLQKNPQKRVGFNGANEVKNHPFFFDVDFDKLYDKQYEALNTPSVSNDNGLQNFDEEFTNLPVHSMHKKSENFNSHFEGFSWEPP